MISSFVLSFIRLWPILPRVPVKSCSVSFVDTRGIRHSVERICERCIPLQYLGSGFERTVDGMHVVLRSACGRHEFRLPEVFREVAKHIPQGRVQPEVVSR